MEFLSMGDFIEFAFLQKALITTLFISLTCGLLSPFIIAKRYALMGSAISHSTILGLSIGMLLFSGLEGGATFLITLAITLVLAMGLAYSSYREKIPADSLIGIFFSFTMGLGILIHYLGSNSKGDLLGLLFGNVLLLQPSDLYIACLITIISFAVLCIPFKNWILVVLDEQTAQAKGLNTKLYHYGFMALLTIVIVCSIKLAGTILINTLLLVPGTFALKISNNLRQTFLNSIVFSVIVSVLGLVFANHLGLPTGASLTVIQFLFLFLAIIIKKTLKYS